MHELVERIRANLGHPMIREGMRKIRSKFVDLSSPGPYGVATFLEADGAAALEDAVRAALAAGVRTSDIGGTSGTREAAAWVAERVAGA